MVQRLLPPGVASPGRGGRVPVSAPMTAVLDHLLLSRRGNTRLRAP
jgi:hypothetical protein